MNDDIRILSRQSAEGGRQAFLGLTAQAFVKPMRGGSVKLNRLMTKAAIVTLLGAGALMRPNKAFATPLVGGTCSFCYDNGDFCFQPDEDNACVMHCGGDYYAQSCDQLDFEHCSGSDAYLTCSNEPR